MDFIRFGRKATLFALVIGSAIIALYYFTAFPAIAFLGIFHLLASIIISGWVVVRLLIFYRKRRSTRRQILVTFAFVAFSYLVAASYLYVGLRTYSGSDFD